MHIRPIILCGGHGTRLWPASRPSRPKQFLALIDAESMFQATVRRMRHAADGGLPIVVAGERHADEIFRQLGAIDCPAIILIEPEGRDSGPALAAAAVTILHFHPEALGVMVASDHHLPDLDGFRTATLIAAEAAREGAIVTFGVAPTSASEAYGYIRPGAPLHPGGLARRVDAFVEKPPAALAREYVAAGYLWNSGNFVFRAQTLMDEFDRYAPEVATAARAAVEGVLEGGGLVRLGPAFRTAPKISIDYAVMEKTERAAVVPLDLVWSDLGAWDAVLAASKRDAQGNATVGDALMFDAQDCLVRAAPGQLVAVLGLRNVGVVVERDAVLVCDLAVSQGVKQVVDRLKSLARPETEALTPTQDTTERLTRAAADLGRWLRTSALPLWWSLGADHRGGGFLEMIAQDGGPVVAPRRARVQARQIYVYALAGVLDWTGPWRQAVAQGYDFLVSHHALPAGGFRTQLHPDGAPADDAVMLYDQAFVLLALGWRMRAGVDTDAEAHALALVETVLEPRRGPRGGFREEGAGGAWLSNPHMHLFEAALAWVEVGGSPTWGLLADEIAELALRGFIDAKSGALRERFDADWTPAAGRPGRIVEPGHQFEWAWLLERWSRLRAREDAHAAAAQLFHLGTAHGVDRARGVAINALHDDFTVADADARLWPQTEWLKAALLLSKGVEGPERVHYLEQAAAAAAALARYLDTPVPGLWRDVMRPDESFVEQPAPASSLYHIACAIAELESWAASQLSSPLAGKEAALAKRWEAEGSREVT